LEPWERVLRKGGAALDEANRPIAQGRNADVFGGDGLDENENVSVNDNVIYSGRFVGL